MQMCINNQVVMKNELVKYETAKLAKEVGFDEICYFCYVKDGDRVIGDMNYQNSDLLYITAPEQSLLQRWIRETRGVHIEIHRNASGYYFSMCKSDGGTDLGWSDHSGPNDSGVWNNFEDALENAIQFQLLYNLPENTKVIKHWGNYVEFALTKYLKSNKNESNSKNKKTKGNS